MLLFIVPRPTTLEKTISSLVATRKCPSPGFEKEEDGLIGEAACVQDLEAAGKNENGLPEALGSRDSVRYKLVTAPGSRKKNEPAPGIRSSCRK